MAASKRLTKKTVAKVLINLPIPNRRGVLHLASELTERFNEAGIVCEYVDGETPMFDREDVFKRFKSGETKIISSCVIDARLQNQLSDMSKQSDAD